MSSYDISTIAKTLPFKEAVVLAYRMLYDKKWEADVQNFATDLLYAIRKNYAKEWNSCWKLDVLLGLACEITWRDEEKYLAYKDASFKISPLPPSLMVLLAECYDSPGTPPINRQDAKNLLLQALSIEKTVEGASFIKYICELDEEWDQVEYWNAILKEAEQKDLHIRELYPSFIKDIV